MENIEAIAKKYEKISPVLDERMRRLWAGVESSVIGFGGIAVVSKATGMSRNTIIRGEREIDEISGKPTKTIRKTGGGRKKAIDIDPRIQEELTKLIEPVTRGDPESPLKWTCKSLRKLSSELKNKGHNVSHRIVGELLHKMGYSLQANRKILEGSSHPDRNAQFEFINQQVIKFQNNNQPIISVDTKKKELVGNFKNNGQEWRPKGEPEDVFSYDFPIKGLGRAIPYGIYDQGLNKGWVSVGTDNDTAEFAVETIRRWWDSMGKTCYANATKLLITADGGGSNGSRVKLWKTELQKFANEIRMNISVCHFPPCTSKWNKIEHRLFSHITKNWRGKPLISHEVIVNLIANTTTETGLEVSCDLNLNKYQKGIKVSDEELSKVNIVKEEFHGEWNYTIHPTYK